MVKYLTKYGYLGVLDGRLMLFATEDEYYEIKNEKENEQ